METAFDVRAERMATAHRVFENGVRANFQCGGPDMDLWGGVRAIGPEGFIEVFWDGDVRRAVPYADPSWSVEPEPGDKDDPMVDIVSETLDCLKSGRTSQLSSSTVLIVTQIVLAIHESVRRRARIEIPFDHFVDHPLHDLLDSTKAEPVR